MKNARPKIALRRAPRRKIRAAPDCAFAVARARQEVAGFPACETRVKPGGRRAPGRIGLNFSPRVPLSPNWRTIALRIVMLFRRPAPASPPPAAVAGTVAPAAPSAASAHPVILVVDDSVVIRSAVTKMLAAHNYEILQADDGVNGLAAFEKDQARISLVLSDVFMPRTDGLTMAKEIRRRSRALPIVLMSSKLDEDSRWVAEEAGFRLVPKPFKDSYLLELIARMLRRPAA